MNHSLRIMNKQKSALPARLQKALHHGDRPWLILQIVMGLAVLALLVTIGIMLWQQSADARAEFGLGFLLPTSNPSWDPVNDNFQSWPFIYGTLITSLVALAVALPFSLGIAIFLAELCPAWLRAPLGTLIELLAAIPSVVYGLWGIFVFLPVLVAPFGKFLGSSLGQVPGVQIFFNGIMSASGSSRLGAAMILAIMITPTIASVSRDVLMAIPADQREAAFGLGATPWETISQILLPYGASGILGAVILGLGRALGETMAVTMVIGNSVDNTLSLLRPGYTMSSIIANEFAEAVNPLHSQALIEVALLLFVITLLLNGGARFLLWHVAKNNPTGGR